MTQYPAEEDEVLLLRERVGEAQRYAKMVKETLRRMGVLEGYFCEWERNQAQIQSPLHEK